MRNDARSEICRIFTDWETGEITCQGVQHWAQNFSTDGADVYASKIVHHLRGLGEYLITTDDIPTYLEGMEMEPEVGVNWLAGIGNNFDAKARATDLKNDPFYGPHTKAILRELS